MKNILENPITKEKLKTYKSRDYVSILCPTCKKVFSRKKHHVQSNLVRSINSYQYCNHKCRHVKNESKVQCLECEKVFTAVTNKRKFCSKSCSASYNNKNKKHGVRRSKLESFIEEKLIDLYPNLEIHFNRKDAINSELDVYIPSISIAFELNGIFHYEPIFGEEKLKSIINNDNRKFQACLEKGIELCIIDSSQMNYFKKEKAYYYLNIITSLIDSKL